MVGRLHQGGFKLIFSIDDHIQQIIQGTKTQTRRLSDRYKVGNTYAVQPGRGEPGITEGRIYIGGKDRENKPDLSDIPPNARETPAGIFAVRWKQAEAGYPINKYNAEAEGGYTPEQFEQLFEEMYPGWQVRYAYYFHFFTTKQLQEAQP